MATLDTLKIELLPKPERFNVFNFNKLGRHERKSLIIEFATSVCAQYAIKISPDNFSFLSPSELIQGASGYDPTSNKIMLSDEFINKSAINYKDVFYMLDNVVHETTHYIQNALGIFEESLNNPFTNTNYYYFQKHEMDAYASSFYVLSKLIPFIDAKCQDTLDYVQKMFELDKNEDRDKLISRGYGDNEVSVQEIEQQISDILPFHKHSCEFARLQKNSSIEQVSIKNFGTRLDIIEKDNEWYCHISRSYGSNTNHMYCLVGEVCFVDRIYGSDGMRYFSTNINDKQDLITILNKLINVYNERYTLSPCRHIEVVPISLFDNKSDYDIFLGQPHQILKISEPESIFTKFISINKIRRECKFGLLDHKVEKYSNVQDDTRNSDEQNIDDINI